MPNVIRLNDPTSHGGKVSKVAATHFTVGGVAVGSDFSPTAKQLKDKSFMVAMEKALADGVICLS